MGRRRGVCLVVAAPSGAGKSTIVRMLLQREAMLTASVSVTTRAPRDGERDGVDYTFVSPETFEMMAAQGDLLEYARVFGRGYGTPRRPVEAALAEGRDVILDIDWQGWRQLKTSLPADVVGVFLLPPSLAALSERLHRRGSDDEAEMNRRMAAARAEISHWDEFDHLVVNDDLADCVAAVQAVLQAARCTVARNIAAAALAQRLLD